MTDLAAVVTTAVAASKEAPADVGAAEAAGDVVGTREGGGGEGSTGDGDAPPETAAEPAIDAQPAADTVVADKTLTPPEPKAEESDFEKIPAKDAQGRTNRIPHPRVKVMVDTAVAKATQPLVAERDTLKATVAQRDTQLQRTAQVEHILYNEPKQFLGILRELPGYKDLLAGIGEDGTPAAAAATAVPTELDFSQAPQPDAEGGAGYTAKGLQALLAWTAKESAAIAKAAAVAEAEARLGERYKPIEETFQQHQQEEERNAARAQHVNATLEEAGRWLHFKSNEAAIYKVLQDDSAWVEQQHAAGNTTAKHKHNLASAYQQVVFGRLTTDRQKIREELIAESRKAPVNTSAGGSRVAAENTSDAPQSLEDVVKAAIASSGVRR